MSFNGNSSEEEADDQFPATHTDTDYYVLTKEKYGKLAKTDFLLELTSSTKTTDLKHHRAALYDYSRANVPTTPQGTLVNRKGPNAVDKLAEDIFHIYHFIEGDSTLDLVKLLNSASRKEHSRLEASHCLVPDEDRVEDNNEQDDLDLRTFCVHLMNQNKQLHIQISFLIQENNSLREENKSYRVNYVEIKKDVDKLKAAKHIAEVKVQEDRNDIKEMKERMITMDDTMNAILYVNFAPEGKKITEKVISGNSSDTPTFADVTKQWRKTQKQPNGNVTPEANSSNNPEPVNLTVFEPMPKFTGKLGAESAQKKNRNTHTELVDTTQRMVPTEEACPSGQAEDGNASTVQDLPIGNDDDVLEGFQEVRRKPRSKAFYIGSVRVKRSNEHTAELLKYYLGNKGVDITHCIGLKRSGPYLSFKLNVAAQDDEKVADPLFWPKGVSARPWDYRDTRTDQAHDYQ